MLRTPVQRGDTFLDGESCDPCVLLDRIARATEQAWPELGPAPPLPQVSLKANHLVRAETYYRGAGTSRDVAGKILPGAIGSVELQFVEPLGTAWATRMLLAGLCGIGKSTAMGQGRFHVEGARVHEHWPPRAAKTLCERMADETHLTAARESLRSAGPTPGADAITRDEFLESLTYRWPMLREALATGEHRAKPLRGLLLERPDGRIRALAIPTLEDRFLQRAAVEELSPALDELFEETSFAYRRGLSRRNAEHFVRRAYDEGFRHVLDADLRAFFDRVNWSLLRMRLCAYLGQDPAIELLMRWVEAPVEFGTRLIARKQGLPQGAVVSPLLANLYLDSFDEAIAAQGFRLARYADDFVVLCKSPQEVSRARSVVESELARLRLELAADKTSVTDFERGFEFLGYLFTHSVSLSRTPQPRNAVVLDTPEELATLRPLDPRAAETWLEEWLGAEVRELEVTHAPCFQTALAPNSPARRNVYVVQPGLRLSGSRRGLRVYDGETLLDEVAWSTISEVAVLGQRAMAPALFQQAMRHRVPISLYTRAGKPVGVVLPERVRSPSLTTRAHWHYCEDLQVRLRIARALVQAKIHNQRLLVRHQPGDNEAVRQRLALLSEQATRAEALQRLRGLEGAAAHAYFSAWSGWLPPELGFTTRSGRGAVDPVNAVLNLLYTQLFHRCWLACIANGLDPFLGILHEGRDRYAALAADLQEPFRFLCDRLALELFHRRRLTAQDFVRQQKPELLTRLTPEALKLVLGDWEQRLENTVRSAAGETRTYRGHIMAQAERLAQMVHGQRQELAPFQLKW